MKTKYYSIAVVFLAVVLSCSPEEQPSIKVSNTNIQLGDIEYSLEDHIMSNENCNNLFVTLDYSSNFPYILNMTFSKKGDIISLSMANSSNNYRLLPFNLEDTFDVTYFKYDSVQSVLDISFEGKLFSNNRNTSTPLRGSIRKLKINKTNCTASTPYFEAELYELSGKAKKFLSISSVAEFDNKLYRQYYYSNNGYRLVIESKTNFKNSALATYSFKSGTESAIQVTFQKYIGNGGAIISDVFNINEWQTYQVEGNIELKQIINQSRGNSISGILAMTIFDDTGNNIYHIKRGDILFANVAD